MDSQLRVLDLLPFNLLLDMYQIYPVVSVLEHHFSTMSDAQRDQILNHLRQTNEVRHRQLDQVNLEHPVVRSHNDHRHRQLEHIGWQNMYQRLDAATSVDQALSLAEQCSASAKKATVLILGQDLCAQFLERHKFIGNKVVFQKYLNLIHFLDRLFMSQPTLDKELGRLVDPLVRAMTFMPSKWVHPILKQLPLRFGERLIRHLQRYERHADFEKRDMYCKLLRKIQTQAKQPDAEFLRFLLSKG